MEKGKPLEVKDLDTIRVGKLVHFVNPKDILFLPQNDFTICSTDEKVSDGDWDLGLERFDRGMVKLSFEDVFVRGMPWSDTSIWNSTYQAGACGIVGYESLPREEVDVWKRLRCMFLDYLFNSMKHFGYQQDPWDNFVSLIIGRNGEVILNNGRHRLACAQILNISSIPVLIDVRHKQWLDFKNDVLDYAKEHDGKIYSPFTHVDLKDIPARQKDRRNDILRSISKSTKTILDLGAQWGLITGFLESKGYICTAVENDKVELSFLNKIRKMSNCSFRIADEDIYQFIMDVDFGHYDCVLALSIFHHFLKTKAGYGQLVRMLSRMDCNEMIFQMPDRDELAKFNPYKNLSCGEFLQFVISHSCLNRHEEIGCQQSRRMFRLWRE